MPPSPHKFDRWWPELVGLNAARGRAAAGRHIQRLMEHDGDDITDLVTIATIGLGTRIRQMTETDTPTDEQVWLITRALDAQLVKPPGYTRERFYYLLHAILRQDLRRFTSEDLLLLIQAVWAVKLTYDSEAPRRKVIGTWLNEALRATPPEAVPSELAAQIVPEVTRQIPTEWDRIEGTLMVVAGQVLATLSVTRDGELPAAFHYLIDVPSAVAYRNHDRNWWRLGITVTKQTSQVDIPDQYTPPDPAELLRLSDFRAEKDLLGLEAVPEWVRSYTLRRTIAYTPEAGERRVVGTAEALSIVRSEARHLGLGPTFRLDDLVAVRLPVGYRVFMYQGPDIPFGDLILDSPIFYVGDDGEIFRPRSTGNPLVANEEFRVDFAEHNGYDSTTGQPWPTVVEPVIGPPRRL